MMEESVGLSNQAEYSELVREEVLFIDQTDTTECLVNALSTDSPRTMTSFFLYLSMGCTKVALFGIHTFVFEEPFLT
jgi:hypothetical protein